MSSTLNIIIRTLKKGSGEQDSARGMAKLKSAAVSAAKALAAVTAAGVALKQVYSFAREGAELEMVSNRFDRLAANIGVTGDALRNDLTDATEGLYSQSQLMASASDLMALGLAKNHDEVLRLASVSAGLNMDMNQLVLTLTNMTTMRFDALGVSVDGFDDKVRALEQSGLSAADAFKEAFLTQAEEQLALVGNAADEGVGSFLRFEASLRNFADAAKRDLAPAVGGIVGDLADLIDVYNDYQTLLGESSGAQNTYLRTLARARYGIADTEHVLMALREEFKRINTETASYDHVLSNFNFTVTASGDAAAAAVTDYAYLLDAGAKLSESTADYTAELESLTDQLATARSQGYAETSKKVLGLKSDIEALEAAHKRQTDQFLLDVMAQMGVSAEMQLQYAMDAGLIDQASANTVLAMQAVGQALADNTLEYEDQAEALSYVIDHMDNLNGKSADSYLDIWVTTHKTTVSGYGGGFLAGGGGQEGADNLFAGDLESFLTGGGGNGYNAQGGSWVVPTGGGGGIDGSLVAFMATPGERVTVSPPGRESSGGSVNYVTINVNGARDARAVADEIARRMRGQGVRV